MRRCFVEPADWTDVVVQLSVSETHHLLRVLRASPGDLVGVFDGTGREGVARYESYTNQSTKAKVGDSGRRARLLVQSESIAKKPAIAVILVQALPKSRKMDLIVEKATELSVAEIRPLVSERSVVRLDSSSNSDRHDRWRRISLSAAKQCGYSRLPIVAPCGTFEQVLSRCDDLDLFFLGSLGENTVSLRDGLRQGMGDGVRRIGVLVGPEGDLTESEIDRAVEKGAIPVSFGHSVLRSETAAIYALSALRYELM